MACLFYYAQFIDATVTSLQKAQRNDVDFFYFSIFFPQNALAYVNAAFLVKMNSDLVVMELPSLVFGGITPAFVSDRL